MKFGWRTIVALVAIPSSIYLSYVGFAGKMPTFMAGLGWALVGFNILLDLLSGAAKRQQQEAMAEMRRMLEVLERLHGEAEQCCCGPQEGCSDCCDTGRVEMSRVISRDGDDYIVAVELPKCVPACGDTLFKLNSLELVQDEDYWFDQRYSGEIAICFPEETVCDDSVITAIDIGNGLIINKKTLWSWSEVKGDIIMNGSLVFGQGTNCAPAPKPVEDDRCKSCGTMGVIARTACICPACGMVVWGC